MARIFKLDRHVADLIAAGEVVERPASVVKELIENSVDAGAKNITVEIKRGGLELIRVTDDGCGISREDIPTAFLRHATSKISKEADLTAISTMGFRGEALASVAAVSKVEVFTRERGAIEGTCYVIEGGEEISDSDAGAPEGTSVIIRELFYNTPARMKFIKRDITEAAQVQSVCRRAALGTPEVAFRFIKDGEEVLRTAGDGKLESAVYAVFGGTFAAGMISARNEQDGIKVTGLVSKPAFSQGNRTKQEFFVNSRSIKSRLIGAALEEAYKNKLMQNRFPACVLYIEINPTVVDVNVHPAKTEVKFAFERQVFDAVYLAVKAAVDTGDARMDIARPRPRPEREDAPVQSAIPKTAGFISSIYQNTTPPKDTGKTAVEFYRSLSSSDLKNEYPEFTKQLPTLEDIHIPADSSTVTMKSPVLEHYDAGEEPVPALPTWRIVGEVFSTFIVVEDGVDLLFIDKHAAHERVIFERLKAERHSPLSQVLMQPLVFSPDRQDFDALVSNMDVLSELGFDLDDFGGGSLICRAMPSELTRSDGVEMLEEIAMNLVENRRLEAGERWEEALRLVSCKAALKAGSITTYAEQYALVERVMRFDDIKFCPHGRPVVALLTQAELERRIGRQT